MELSSTLTRRTYLAGAVAFPTPFPSAAGISIEDGERFRSARGADQNATFVIVQERSGPERATIRAVSKHDVAAIFFPGVWEDGREQGRTFRFTDQHGVHDLDAGEWFLNPDIDADAISRRLNINITRRDSGAKGIVFVPQHRPVLTITECTQTAGAAEAQGGGCDPCCCGGGCDPCCC